MWEMLKTCKFDTFHQNLRVHRNHPLTQKVIRLKLILILTEPETSKPTLDPVSQCEQTVLVEMY